MKMDELRELAPSPPKLPEGITIRVVSGKIRFLAQIRIGGKRVSKTFSVMSNAITWIEERKRMRAKEGERERERPGSEAPKARLSLPLERIDAIKRIFINSPNELSDQEFVCLYWEVGEYERLPIHKTRYKQIRAKASSLARKPLEE